MLRKSLTRRYRCVLLLEQGDCCRWRGLYRRLYFGFGGGNACFIRVFMFGVEEYSGVYLFVIKCG